MSRLGTWADHIIIQAVVNSQNLRINIKERASNFNQTTIVNSIYANDNGGNARDIYVGHVDEVHYTGRIKKKVDNFEMALKLAKRLEV